MPVAPAEHDGITGVTSGSDGHRLLGVLHLARGSGPKLTALLLHGCPGLQRPRFRLEAELLPGARDRVA